MPSRQTTSNLSHTFSVAIRMGVFLLGIGTEFSHAAVTANGSNSANPTSMGANPIIGVSDIGRMTITAGGVVVSGAAIVGDQPTGIGLVTVTDFNSNTAAASTWTTTSLMVADEGTGRLEILNGAVVGVDFAAALAEGDLVIGNSADSLGAVIVSGFGAMLRLGDDSTIGQNGTGLLVIEDEGYVIATNDAVMGNDLFTIGVRGRVELNNGRLRTESFTNNGAVVGTGRIDSENTIANSPTGRFEANSGDRLVVNAVVDNDGEIAIVGGEIEFLEAVTNSNAAAKVTLLNGVVRFPKTGFGFDSTTGLLANTGGTSDIYGTMRVQGAGSKIVVAGGSTAVFHDPVTNTGGVIEAFPGSTPIFLQGLTTTGAGSVLSIHLADPRDETDLGQVEVAGSAQLAGNLSLTLSGGYVPRVGDSFQILTAAGGITGSLGLAAAPILPGGMQWDIDINPTAVILSVVGTGDYDGNGMVNAADYVVWRNMLGQAGPGLAADGNGSGVVDAADYEIWRSRFGTNAVEGVGAITAVPEPAAWLLLTITSIFALRYQRKPIES